MATFQVGRDLKGSLITSDVASVGTSYDAAKVHTHIIGRRESGLDYEVPYGECQGIWVEVDTISSATSLTVMLCADADGDVPMLSSGAVTIDTGITTNTKGMIQVFFGMPFYCGQDTDAVYLFFKTNAGSCTVKKSQLTWKV